MSKVPINALSQIVHDPRYDQANVNIRREVCAAIERSPATLSRLLDERTSLDHNQSARLGRHLSDDFDDTRWARCFVGSRYLILPKRFGQANGRHDDDASDYLEAGGEWVQQMGRGDKAMAQETLNHIKTTVLPNMQAEVNEL